MPPRRSSARRHRSAAARAAALRTLPRWWQAKLSRFRSWGRRYGGEVWTRGERTRRGSGRERATHG
eukprot:129383-Chlamydomonas_euryale.AAC.1